MRGDRRSAGKGVLELTRESRRWGRRVERRRFELSGSQEDQRPGIEDVESSQERLELAADPAELALVTTTKPITNALARPMTRLSRVANVDKESCTLPWEPREVGTLIELAVGQKKDHSSSCLLGNRVAPRLNQRASVEPYGSRKGPRCGVGFLAPGASDASKAEALG